MKRSVSRLLVIYASVTRSAGETEHPVSRSCREALLDILDICHHMIVTPDLQSEWKKHWNRCKERFKLPRKIRWVNPVRDGTDCLRGL